MNVLAAAARAALIMLLPASMALAQGTTPTEKNAQSTLEKAGYKQVRDLKASPKGVAATATKDGKTVSVVVDPTGHIKEQPAEK
ncbi:MAG TPA: PepSY domain-containing protein [Vineibacter sp.]|nr:PepSY domain-containing protein [Vineibacter sp.]